MTNDGTKPAGTATTADRPAETQRGVTDELKTASAEVSREVRATAESLREDGAGLTSTIRQGLSDQAQHQKNAIADRLGAVAERAQRTASDLRQDEAWLGQLLGRGADELAGLAEDIRHQDVGDLMGSVELFARRQPALFMGASVALGFALTRFVGAGAGEHGDGRYRQPAMAGSPGQVNQTPGASTVRGSDI